MLLLFYSMIVMTINLLAFDLIGSIIVHYRQLVILLTLTLKFARLPILVKLPLFTLYVTVANEDQKFFRKLEYYLTKTKRIIEVEDYNFVKSVERNFNRVRKFINSIGR